MTSLTKRNGNYSIIFKTTVNGKSYKKTYALGTKYKKITEQKKLEYEKLYDGNVKLFLLLHLQPHHFNSKLD